MDPRAPGVWRLRNAAIFAFLARHSATTDQIARRFFPGRTLETRKKKASRWLVRQRRRGRVRVIGVVQRRETGRPEIVYGRRCPQDQIEHEVRVAETELLLGTELQREAKAGRTQADAVMVREGRTCFIEVDNSGNMTAAQMRAKWRRYEGVDGFILVIAVTEGRMQRLRKGADLVKDAALFTTFERLRSGMPEPWVDWYGKTAGI